MQGARELGNTAKSHWRAVIGSHATEGGRREVPAKPRLQRQIRMCYEENRKSFPDAGSSVSKSKKGDTPASGCSVDTG